MSVVRLGGGGVPKTVREWDRVFSKLNEVITETSVGISVTADNLPAQSASYVTLSNNATLGNDRALTSRPNETVVYDAGAGSAVTVGLAEKGTPGAYPKVQTDKFGRVVAGADLLMTDMPVPLSWFHSGAGTPNGVVSAPMGHVYLNSLGGTNTTLWVKTLGSGNTGWTAK